VEGATNNHASADSWCAKFDAKFGYPYLKRNWNVWCGGYNGHRGTGATDEMTMI